MSYGDDCRRQSFYCHENGAGKTDSGIGIREQRFERHVLRRETEQVDTPIGVIRRKNVSGYGVKRSKWEYEDVAAAAKEHGISLAEAELLLNKLD